MNNYRVTITDTDKLRYVWYSTADSEGEALAQVMPEILSQEIPVASIKMTFLGDIQAIASELAQAVSA
jgi:hypothetical protein